MTPETYIVPDMPAQDYHARPEFSSGFLKRMKQSPYHANYSRQNPSEPTPAMRFGTAFHTAFLEPEKFAEEYVQMPEGLDRRTKEGKALWAEIEASGRQVLSAADMLTISNMRDVAHDHPFTQQISLLERYAEPSVFSVLDGVAVRIRPDLLIPPCRTFPAGLIIDAKTTGDASSGAFGRTAWSLDYHIQAAMYSAVCQRLFGVDQPVPFAWMAIERDAPHGCKYYLAQDNLMEHGAREVRELLLIGAECQRTGIWPGYSTEVEPLALPGYAERVVNGGDDAEDVAAIGYVAA